jgi:hypothetical protein
MMEPFGWSAIGAAAWEGARRIIRSVAKRNAEKRETQRKLLHDEIRQSISSATKALDLALDYYQQADLEQRRRLAHAVIHEIKKLATHLQNVNRSLSVLGYTNYTGARLIAFRQALTLDDPNSAAPLDHAALMRRYDAFQRLHCMLHELLNETS